MSSMMMATRGASANATPQTNSSKAVTSARPDTLLRVAVHDRPGLQVFDGLGELQVGFAIQQTG